MIGTSAALTSTMALSMPRPAKADIRCSTVETCALALTSVVPSVVSPTFSARAGMSDGLGRSVRRNTMPVSARRRTHGHQIFVPLCRPTPVARMLFLRVR